LHIRPIYTINFAYKNHSCVNFDRIFFNEIFKLETFYFKKKSKVPPQKKASKKQEKNEEEKMSTESSHL
jgi:hypothetical protein